jgi:hypothetical protein
LITHTQQIYNIFKIVASEDYAQLRFDSLLSAICSTARHDKHNGGKTHTMQKLYGTRERMSGLLYRIGMREEWAAVSTITPSFWKGVTVRRAG